MENVNILSLYRSRFRSSMKVTVISFNIFDGETVSTEELVHVFEEELPRPLWYEGRRKLDWFLEGWIEGTAIPELEARDVRIVDKAGVITVTGVIVTSDLLWKTRT